MRKSDFRDQAIDLLSEAGAQYEENGDTITWWFEPDKKTRAKIPMHGGDYRGLRNSAAKWRRDLEEAKPAYLTIQTQTDAEKDKWKAYLDKCLRDIKVEFDAKFDRISGEISATTDIALEAGLKVDGFAKAFQGVFANPVASQPLPPTPVALAPAPAPVPPKPTAQVVVEKAKKGLEDLNHIRNQKWAVVIARMNAEFALDDLDGRILYFLHECGPQTAHALREAGVWKPIESATRFLENMEAEGLVRHLTTNEWAITQDGITYLEEVPEDEEVQPVRVQIGLGEALSVARGESGQTYVPPVQPAEALKLTVVPSGPRILKPVASLDSFQAKLTFPEKAMIVLLKKEMTIEELQRAIGHRSSLKSLANLLYRCERENDYIQYFYGQGKVYRITEKGRAYVRRISEYAGHTLAAS